MLAKRFCLALTIFIGVIAVKANAQLTLEITSGVDNPTKVAVVPFRRDGASKAYGDLAAIVDADLSRSGRFEVLPRRDMLSSPATREEMYFRDWSALGIEYVLIGRTKIVAEKLVVNYELYDVCILSGDCSRVKLALRQKLSDTWRTRLAIEFITS